MSNRDSIGIDSHAPPFDQFSSIHWLGRDRSGRDSMAHARHHLYVGRSKRRRVNLLVKVTSKPGIVYEQNLVNEIATLSTINRELPDSRYFPFVEEHGRLGDGRTYLIMSFFDELPLAASIGPERIPGKLVTKVMTAIEVAVALSALHRLKIFHVDLNPMNILYRTEKAKPVVRIVDFESSYEHSRHAAGVFYNPPTTPGFAAPEIATQPPDGRSDVFSLGAVLYTMLAGFDWTLAGDVRHSVETDTEVDPDLKAILLEAVHPQPARRCSSIGVFQSALRGYLERIWPGRAW